jgi:hypothetical protein
MKPRAIRPIRRRRRKPPRRQQLIDRPTKEYLERSYWAGCFDGAQENEHDTRHFIEQLYNLGFRHGTTFRHVLFRRLMGRRR